MVQTLIYADPMAAQLDTSTSTFTLVTIALGTVSILISYYAVQRLLNISGPKTRFWFLILPLSTQCFTLMTLVLSN